MSAPTAPITSLRPNGATIVVLLLDVRDARSWAGADTTVHLVPQPADGQPVDDAGRPVITHAATGVRAVVHDWTTSTAGSGLAAIPALASRDDAFEGGGFGGYELHDLTGTRLIEVPDTADEIEHASAELVAAVQNTCIESGADFSQLGIAIDAPVRVLPVSEAPPLPAPAFVVPDGYDTSRTVARRIDRRVAVHNEQTDAHAAQFAAIRAALSLATGDESLGQIAAIAGTGQLSDALGQVTDAQVPAGIARVAAVTDMIAAALAALIGSPGVDLDTWIELVTWIRSDRSGLTTLGQQVAAKLAIADLTSTLAPKLAGVGGTWARDPSTGVLTFTVTSGGSGSSGVDQQAVATMWSDEPRVTYTGGKFALDRPDVADLAVAGGTLRPAAARALTIRRITPTTAVTVNLGVPTGTPAPGAVCRFQLINRGAVDLTVNYESAMSNASGQPFPFTLKAGTMLNGSMIAGYVVDDATPKWTLLGAVPETLA